MVDRRTLFVTLCGVTGVALALCLTAPSAAHGPHQTAGSSPTVAELIQQLGAPEYARREAAQARLREMGLEAFDAVYAAQHHDDTEIAMRARYLVRSMEIDWAGPDDPLEIRQVLHDYGRKSSEERRNLMEQLRTIRSEASFRALCRLVRFEPSQLLSKRAALLAMELHFETKEPEDPRALIDATLAESRRPAADWVRAYAQLPGDPEGSVDRWQSFVRGEQTTMAEFPEESSLRVHRDLIRWHARVCLLADRHEQGIEAARRSLRLVEGNRESLLDTIDWFLENGIEEMVAETVDRFPVCRDDPLLLYRLAESHWRLEQRDDAELAASQAARLLKDPRDHVVAALALQHDGLSRWAEREYREVISGDDPFESARARFLLAELLDDIGQHEQAAEVLWELEQELEQNADMRELVAGELQRTPAAVRSRRHYFTSRHFAGLGDTAQERHHVLAAIESESTNPDALIALYRLSKGNPGDEETCRTLLHAALEAYRERIRDSRDRLENERSALEKSRAYLQLASTNNQFAWLVSNTEGDLEEALLCSQRALELRPDTAGYLDTLANCYFALGDVDRAVRVQRQAIELEPHSFHLSSQFNRFRDVQRRREQGLESGTGEPAARR